MHSLFLLRVHRDRFFGLEEWPYFWGCSCEGTTGHWLNATVQWWRHSGIFAQERQNRGGPAQHHSGPPSSDTCWWYYNCYALHARSDACKLSWGRVWHSRSPWFRKRAILHHSWAMVFPSDHPADWEPNLEHEAAAKTDCGALKAKRRKAWYQYVHKQYQQLQYRPIRTEYMQNHNIRVNTYQNTYPIRTNTTGARPKPVC